MAGAQNGLADPLSRNPPDTADVADIPNMIPYAAQIARVNHMERKAIRISRDLMNMAELGMVCLEFN